ncbi:MAG: DUF2058 family protein [Myxococcales bacterium]
MQSLKDKLLQAGLIPKDYRPGETPEQRSARMNREQADKRNRIAQIVAQTRVTPQMGEHTFFFSTRSRKLRRLLIDDAVRVQLEKGELAVVEWPNQPDFPWALVPRPSAEKILKIDEAAIRFYVRSDTEQYGVARDPDMTE